MTSVKANERRFIGAGTTAPPVWLAWALPRDADRRWVIRLTTIRLLVAANLTLGAFYLSWRWTDSINWAAWWIAVPLIVAETYSYLDAVLFGLMMWRLRRRVAPPPPARATVDVFITCYNEPVDVVRETVRAAIAITHPHTTYVLDDGNSAEMRAMAEAEGAGYIVRSVDYLGKQRHAKAGNLNNALFQTSGEFLLILDADQIARPTVLDAVLGYFEEDPKVAFVQTPQYFYNVPPGDPFGSQAPLFYGPIQQGKDGWGAAFFCGSNAVLRREALMQLGITRYVTELEVRVRRALHTAGVMLRAAEWRLSRAESAAARTALAELRAVVQEASRRLHEGAPIQDVTWTFQRRAEEVSRQLVSQDLASIRAELAEIPGVDLADLEGSLSDVLDDEASLNALSSRTASPLTAIETVRALLLSVDVDREHEAQPVMPMATISVTEDMATAMRLHALGWHSVYHHEDLVQGLAPEDLRSALQQRLRWAQGTIQVLLRENPLVQHGLSLGQRLMYLGTMWTYLSGFAALVYLAAPVLYLFFGWLPVRAFSATFFWHLLPFLAVNQLLFLVVGWGLSTWRGQQYSLALFPLWIKAVTSACQNVWFGKPLGFVVTPKTRQGGVYFGLVWPQLVAMALLLAAALYGVARLTLGLAGEDERFPIAVNLVWIGYDLAMLSVVLRAATYQPEEGEPAAAGETAAEAHGRVGAGR